MGALLPHRPFGEAQTGSRVAAQAGFGHGTEAAAARLLAAVGLHHPGEEGTGPPGVEHGGDRLPKGLHEVLVAARHQELPLLAVEVGTEVEIPPQALPGRAQEIGHGLEMAALAHAIEIFIIEQLLHQIAADEARGACDQDFHALMPHACGSARQISTTTLSLSRLRSSDL